MAAFDPSFEPLAAVLRGGTVESLHRGALAVVDETGALLGSAGDPALPILLRSSAKPFQAAAVVASGAAGAFSLTEQEIALMGASHVGSPEHVQVAERLLARAGAPASALVCGGTEHMCSGKHAGMVLLAAYLKVPWEGYHLEEHPVQQRIREYITTLLGDAPRSRGRGAAGQGDSRPLFAGIDGCGVPVIGVGLDEAAWLFAALAAGATPALARVRDAMLANPVLVAGEGRLDTTLIRSGEGVVLAKGGAEGVQGVGLRANPGAPGALGLAMKIEDGSGRAMPVLTAAFLDAWGLTRQAAAVADAHSPALLDRTGREVGAIEAVVERTALRRRRDVHPAGGETSPGRRRLFGRKGEHVTVSRGDEKEVARFLREQWPDVDQEYFGRSVEWTAQPYALVYRRDRVVVGVLRGHFIGGLASVDELMVGEGSRGQGLGSLLLGRFEEEAKRRQCARIVLRAVKGTRAEDFYRKRGYHPECVQLGYEFGYDYVRLTCDADRALGDLGHAAREAEGEV